MLLLLCLLFFAVILLLLLWPRNRRRRRHMYRRGTRGFRYHGVSIAPGPQCCNAVREVADHRYLQESIPMLPLPECDCTRCQCTYRHYEDRRNEGDRRTFQEIVLGITQRPDGPEHRNNRGRRRQDYSRQQSAIKLSYR